MRALLLVLVALLPVACGHAPVRPPPAVQWTAPVPTPRDAESAPPPRRDDAAPAFNPCAPTRQHLDSDYTPGGLYAPGVADGGPATAIDVSGVREPEPRPEPRSRYGNRSPYTVLGRTYRVLDSADGYRERGVASWYGTKFNGRATSSGEIYDICVFSAAHKTLPLPSFVRVTNLDNGRSLVVRVNDRGPFHPGRVMDLSYAAAVRLGVDRTGTARVELEALGADGNPPPRRSGFSRDFPTQAQSTPTPAPAGPDDGQRKFVQAGSFGAKANAHRLADRLRDAGVDDVDVDHAKVNNQDVWRVRIGPVAWKNLDRLLAQLRQLNVSSPRVSSE